MIENINLIGISNEQVDLMIEKLGYDIVLSMACNHELVKANIELLKSLGINNINELLLNREGIFLIDTEELLSMFSKFNISQIVGLINEDYTVIDELYKD